MAAPKRTGLRTILITGGSSGIGLALARDLVSKGERVCVVDQEASGSALHLVSKGKGRFFKRDVRGFAAAQEVVRMLTDAFGRVDGLVNCAGISRAKVCW